MKMLDIKQMSVEELEKTIRILNESYYGEGNSEVPDSEYDLLVAELRRRAPDSPILSDLGNDVQAGAKTFRHPAPVLSLNKIHEGGGGYGQAKLREWQGIRQVVVEPKYDGLTLVLYFEQGRFVRAVTRGDGIEGEVIPLKRLTEFMNWHLTETYTGAIRGEVVIPREHETLVQTMGYSNLRACAVGQLRKKHLSSDPLLIKFVPFDAFPFPSKVTSRSSLNHWLTSVFGKSLPQRLFTQRISDSEISELDVCLRQQCLYPTDGLVFKLNEKADIQEAGEATAHHPKDAIAFKFNPECKKTTLRSIEWSIGRTGVLTPVAIFDAVELSGTTVKRASLSNLGNSYQFKKGSLLEVVKSGEIIPYARLLESPESGEPLVPQTCPSCEAPLSSDGINLYCRNPLCRDKIAAKLMYACGKNALDIDGLGIVTAKAIADKLLSGEGMMEEPTVESTFIHHPFLLLMNGMLDTMVENMTGTLILSKCLKLRRESATLAQWIAAMEIPCVGKNRADKLAWIYSDFNSFVTLFPDALRNGELEDFGPVMTQNILDWMKTIPTWEEVTADVYTGDIPNVKGNVTVNSKLRGVSFVITGTLSKPRFAYERLIKERGGSLRQSVSRRTNYLVVGQSPGGHKQKLASLYKIPTITEGDFLAMLYPTLSNNEKNPD